MISTILQGIGKTCLFQTRLGYHLNVRLESISETSDFILIGWWYPSKKYLRDFLKTLVLLSKINSIHLIGSFETWK